ncbi:MAG: phosphonopyruvate decarboxylase [Candidatus Omnitrophica bacterium]|nr:phosphonopyruvate decarboxylase [Candidatus Omnitrophota bacterium]
MIKNSHIFNILKDNGVGFFTGVPDSLLKYLCAYITDNTTDKEHIIAANEGGAVSLAAGYHLATGKIPLVYLQNSGLGNTVNPLLSLADKKIYSIPMVLLIGWRGKPGTKDEPQHIKQGRIQNDLLRVLDIPFLVIGPDIDDLTDPVNQIIKTAKDNSSPVAIVVQPNTFEEYKLKACFEDKYQLTREEAIETILESVSLKDIVISTTGKTSREVYEYRERKKQGYQNDFLTVGSMGHASQIALGVTLNTKKRVICLDGDGAILMHMGALAIIGTKKPKNFIHIVLNNGSHDSVGGQPTVGFSISLTKIAEGCGYSFVESISNKDDLQDALKRAFEKKGPLMIEVLIKKGARPDLGRPKTTPVQNKEALMKLLGKKDD